ncbi:hypothetical protein E2562_007929 [Oryza meyeriana var. granulata]|uniref:Uncharacterized protein n=1 Tax=Oryza meyeriana var. granulata TaxID=110450 RepID=A0A6G1DVJ8_9ORYZ|nr:hypothetical protein E2562_007929 [Oryza meyeriana var. granulata]
MGVILLSLWQTREAVLGEDTRDAGVAGRSSSKNDGMGLVLPPCAAAVAGTGVWLWCVERGLRGLRALSCNARGKWGGCALHGSRGARRDRAACTARSPRGEARRLRLETASACERQRLERLGWERRDAAEGTVGPCQSTHWLRRG